MRIDSPDTGLKTIAGSGAAAGSKTFYLNFASVEFAARMIPIYRGDAS